jgi:hypothetical protein
VRSTIDGMPAYRLEEPATEGRADRVVTWVIARPGTIRNFYRLTAEIRGPSVSELSATVDEIVGGLHFTDGVKTLPSDSGARNRAAAVGLADLERQSSAYACVPRASGEVGHAATDSLPMMPSTDETFEVACSYSIEPSPRQLWRMAVRFEWDAAGSRPAGALDVVAWLNPDGSVAGTEATIKP